jgi:hypothetical protein
MKLDQIYIGMEYDPDGWWVSRFCFSHRILEHYFDTEKF